MIDAAASARQNTVMSDSPPSFEEALAKLEEIADAIEQGEIGLEESVTKYEEGMKLLKNCREILARVEQRITKLEPDAGAGSQSG